METVNNNSKPIPFKIGDRVRRFKTSFKDIKVGNEYIVSKVHPHRISLKDVRTGKDIMSYRKEKQIGIFESLNFELVISYNWLTSQIEKELDL